MHSLAGERVLLRRWREEDRAPFAALNANAQVMEYFPGPLDPAQSDALIDRIEENFDGRGFGLWAVEVPGVAPFIGFCGLAVPGFTAHFTPYVEIGWRLALEHWGNGYATEAAKLALGLGFGPLGFSEIVAFTAVGNRRSRAVMERLGMRHDPADDFDMPTIAETHPLRRHVLYRLKAPRSAAG